MSTLRRFALVYGIVFLLVGIVGFIAGITLPLEHPDVVVTVGMGAVLGLFTVNVVLNLVHLLFGAWGLLAARSDRAARVYAQMVAIAYVLLTVLGFVKAMSLYTLFGLMPLYGHNIWLHAVLAAGAAYFGFFYEQKQPLPGRPLR
jgi:hypothetical protein